MGNYQVRYAAYAASQGRSPAAQLVWDEGEYPGGKMSGFICWVTEAWRRWSSEAGETPEFGAGWSNRQHEAFDAWLRFAFDHPPRC